MLYRACSLWGSITGSGLGGLAHWDRRGVVISVVYLLVPCLPGCLTVLTRGQVSKDAELLVFRHENAVLCRQIGQVRYQPADRLWFAVLSRLIRRRRRGEVFMVTPATLLAWHQRLVAPKRDYASRRRPGRPSTAAAIRKLAIHTIIWNYRPSVWWNPDAGVSPAEREWLETKYPGWNRVFGKHWDVLAQNVRDG